METTLDGSQQTAWAVHRRWASGGLVAMLLGLSLLGYAPTTAAGTADGMGLAVTGTGLPAGLGAALRRLLGPVALRDTRLRAIASASSIAWVQRDEITATDGMPYNDFGLSVALSGTTALVGAYGATINNYSTGAVYVFGRSGTTWTQQAKLIASDGRSGDAFGYSVALRGTTALIGAPGRESFTGAVYVFGRSGTTWIQQAELTASDGVGRDDFGNSVALRGATALIGAPDKNDNAGAAYVFGRNGATWTQQAELTASDSAPYDDFGYSVALRGTTALIGVPSKDSGTGAAYVYGRNGATWTQQAELTASDARAGDYFGWAVALSKGMAFIGAPRKNSNTGRAYMFGRNGATWTQQAELTASDARAGDYFGWAVAPSRSTALVGAYGKNNGAGSTYVFGRSSTTWAQQAELTASDGAANDNFGISVALYRDTVLVGAYGKNSYTGAAYVFGRGTVDTPNLKSGTILSAVRTGYGGGTS